jgi:GNAT superfamily N-acetyltransferase
VRAAEPGDAQAIADLIARCDETYTEWAPEGWSAPSPHEGPVRRRLGDRAAWTALAARDGRAVGVVSWRPVDGSARLSWLFVEPSEWGSGLAGDLLDAAVTAMRDAGHSTAELWVHDENERARSFYERHGWAAGPDRRSHERLGLRMVRYCLSL